MRLSNNIRWNNFVAKNFNNLSEEEKNEVLVWRNHENVRVWMKNSSPISATAHFNFLDNLRNQTDRFYWLVFEEATGKKLGVIYFTSFDLDLQISELGIYANPVRPEKGFGTLLSNLALYIGFELGQLNEIYLTVFPHNFVAIKLYEKLGFTHLVTKEEVLLTMSLKKDDWIKR
jgi:UDP-4-amino-4,6-dideoxy-N-acetyl-beta-L-altrosamine N-acetyltransferase